MKKTSTTGLIRPVTLGDFSKTSMHTYGTFVLMDRAVADVRDGLKPVHRRILWAMHHLKGAGFKKSAKVVGDTMGNFHPHGDKAIYDTLVNMVWDRYPLIEGHGNFGSPTDSAASMRYTEARLTPLASELFADIEVAELVSNYSGDRQEPLVLPSRLPLLLLNGSSGIGVALRATVPPHNLRELVRVLVYFIKKDKPSLRTIVQHMPGPDYGYGVMLSSPEDVYSLYETGSGSLNFRCEYSFESTKSGQVLVVKSLAPGFNMGTFLSKMRKLSDEGLILSCSDGTSADGVRIYIEFADPVVIKERVLPELHTTQSYQFYVVKRSDDSTSNIDSETLFCGGILRLFEEFVSFRRDIENLRLQREMRIAKSDLLKAKALLSAIRNLDKVYEVLQQKHTSTSSLVSSLAEVLSLKESQAKYILEMKVQQLSRMNEETQLANISSLRDTLSSIKKDLENVDEVIIKSLKRLLEFSDPRGTTLGYEVTSPSLSMDSPEKYIISQGSKLTRLDKEPSRRHKFDLLCSASSSVTVVLSNNEAHIRSLAYLTEESFSHPIVGIIPDLLPTLALDSDGKYAAISTPDKDFKVIRGATSIRSAVPLFPSGKVLLTSSQGLTKWYDSSHFELTRAFVRGKSLSGKDELVSVLSLSKDHSACTSEGKAILPGNDVDVSTGPIYVLSSSNFLFVKEDKRDILSIKEAKRLIASGLVERSFPLRGYS